MPSSRIHCRYRYALPLLIGIIFALNGCSSSSSGGGGTGPGGGGSTPVTVMTTSLPGGTVNSVYSFQLAAGGGTSPYAWSTTSNNLPAGLSLSATGVLSGTPTAAASNVAITFKVADSSKTPQTATATLTLTITNAVSTLNITTGAIPNAQINTPYSFALAAAGGAAPYTWSLNTGSMPLPTGLTLNASTGVISGTPTVNANATPITFKVTDSSNPQQIATVGLTISVTGTAPLVITTTSLPGGQVGVVYSTALTASGGTTPYSWQVTAGALPTGLSLSQTGAITGTPGAGTQGTSQITVKVTDSANPAQTASANLSITVTSGTLTITTTTVPSGIVGTAYTTTLEAIGGTTPYAWTLTNGTTLPAGLNLAANGVISGTPTATATNAAFSVKLTDSATPTPQTATANLTITVVVPGSITVSITPVRASLTTTQVLAVTPTTTDSSGVNWTATGGSFSAATSLTGVSVNYTAPGTAGTYTITATSATDNITTATATIYVTNLTGVYTYHDDLARDGVNNQEYALTTSNVNNTTFGKLFSCTADGAIYAQPLWVAHVAIGGGTHNVVVVATMRDSVYAFDADASPCVTYWHQQLIPSGETYGSHTDVGSSDIYPDIGILGTPVIDPSTNRIYLINKTKNTSTGVYHQRLYAMNLADGSNAVTPVDLTDSITVAGSGDTGSGGANCSSSSGQVPFCPLLENQRPGLALVNGVVYASWASHGDNGPWHGWIIGFNASTLSQTVVYNAAPNGQAAGIWMSGGAPAVDSSNNMYVITGNGDFDGVSNFGDSLLKLNTANNLSVSSSFTPFNQAALSAHDLDFGSGAAVVIADLPSGAVPHLAFGGGKGNASNSPGFAGELYVLNRDSLGGYTGPNGPDNVVQSFSFGNAIFCTPAFWNNTLYMVPVGSGPKAFSLNTTTSLLNTTPVSAGASYGFPGATPSISALGNTNGILWAMNVSSYGTSNNNSNAAGPAILHAYDASNISNTELWNSSTVSGDQAGNAVKFTVPTVANGHVYIGTRGSDNTIGGGSTFGELDVYGLKPN